eukprot:4822508-Amphidinium_carterae.1
MCTILVYSPAQCAYCLDKCTMLRCTMQHWLKYQCALHNGKGCETCVNRRTIRGPQFDMVAELALTRNETSVDQEIEEYNEIEDEKENKENKMDNGEDRDNALYDISGRDADMEHLQDERRNNIYVRKNKHKVALPDTVRGRYPQFNEWSGELKTYLGMHNVNTEDIMDDCSKSVTAIVLSDIQDKYTLAEVTRMHNISNCTSRWKRWVR